ncbi:adenylate and guanylate cyclase catalytic domain-containing protein [Cardiosporidium cionae]|uniref:Adenylate and guanylate cyclase catalytic domain-containing protein n=1 Tax=Cardiosporidium cionae TaxID=476202 RepID=A0ABQ7JBM9_9APIC|nr:adenylate and guanylate cyclase catalytic domain-containing protein [Cardiosporidium cionae]|eukprot:KAF8821394.1 adenylate and guanylate cyclase catalytic domain-containing protein [Cardiosporidium cionae]
MLRFASLAVKRFPNNTNAKRMYGRSIREYINYHRRGSNRPYAQLSPELFWVQLPYALESISAGELNGDAGCYTFQQCKKPDLLLPTTIKKRLLTDEAAQLGVSIDSLIPSINTLRFIEILTIIGVICDTRNALIPTATSINPRNCDPQRLKYIRVHFDRRNYIKTEALLRLGFTFLLVVIFLLGTTSFDRAAKKIILEPIERLLVRMEKIRRNPLAMVNMGRDQMHQLGFGNMHIDKLHESEKEMESVESEGVVAHGRKRYSHDARMLKARRHHKKSAPYETVALENTIMKILGLLALGFGEAGAEIIAKNIDNSRGGINALEEGRKINAIFGFCDIRQFTDATEILKEKVMVFVNKVADIVHGTVNEFAGSANKNIGDAFLVVWKLPDKDITEVSRDQLRNCTMISKMADLSVIAFLKIIARINRTPIMEQQQESVALLQQFSPNFRIRMGFGLHVGWAIEGAIGSRFKIDASYLSPHVNIASRLEAATKQYGVYLLLSENLYDCLTPQTQVYCRQIDRVTVKGSKYPLGIFTVDVDPSRLVIEETQQQNKIISYVQTFTKTRNKSKKIWSHPFTISYFLESDKDIIAMRSHIHDDFSILFQKGYAHYEAGEWKTAQQFLLRTQNFQGNTDGPSATLLQFMSTYNFVAPIQWPGYRRLTEK